MNIKHWSVYWNVEGIKLLCLFNVFSGDKNIIIAVNNCLDLYFHTLIIEFFVICQISVQNLRKRALLKVFVGLWRGVGSFNSCSTWGEWIARARGFFMGTRGKQETMDYHWPKMNLVLHSWTSNFVTILSAIPSLPLPPLHTKPQKGVLAKC